MFYVGPMPKINIERCMCLGCIDGSLLKRKNSF